MTDNPDIENGDYVVIQNDTLPRARSRAAAASTVPLFPQPLDGAVFGPIRDVQLRTEGGQRFLVVQIGDERFEIWGAGIEVSLACLGPGMTFDGF
eukprot:5187031-Pyramimonas_sp.AAC.1